MERITLIIQTHYLVRHLSQLQVLQQVVVHIPSAQQVHLGMMVVILLSLSKSFTIEP